MQLAGKYIPNAFPSQSLMHKLASQTSNPELRDAFLTYQYPFRVEDLANSNYSPEVKQTILSVIPRN
jgi:hypothetical protein